MVSLSVLETTTTKLCPAQQEAFNELMEALPIGNIFVVWSGEGMGRTSILEELHRSKGGEFLRAKDYIDELRVQNPMSMDEALEQILMRPLQRNDLVIMDDLDLIYNVICGCGYNSPYPRSKYVEAILTSVVDYVVAHDKTLIFGNQGGAPGPVSNRCYYAGFQKFDVTDYEFICRSYLDEKAARLDFKKVFRFAPRLTGHQLKSACMWMRGSETLDTETFIEYLRKRRMTSNVDLEEVEAVELSSLKGLDALIESLEANIIVPLEQDALASEFNIQPKRGVLLAGPPGTGKTTVGRALAHRLRSKFFLIDGTFISGSRDFYDKVHRVFEAAKSNAPSIIFIDDSDVIFENKDDFGLYRYLLTALDGLESESNRRVCIMMTTMDVSSVPVALVRSGRIELWLETTLPDEKARLEILEEQAEKLPEVLRGLDVKTLAAESDGLTGADLRRLVEDGKILYAYDISRKRACADILSYFQKAIKTIRSNKEKYKEAEEKSRARDAGNGDPYAFLRRHRDFGSDDDDDTPA